jgi:UPF0755 protein
MKKILISLLVIILLVGFGLGFWIWNQFQAVSSQIDKSQTFTIKKGSSVKTIAKNLKKADLIKSDLIFLGYVKYKNIASKIQAGVYQLSPNLNVAQVAHSLLLGLDDVSFTSLEGWRREEIAEALNKLKLSSYSKEKFLDLTEDLEGYLYPNTYTFSRTLATKDIVNIFSENFEKATQDLDWDKTDLTKKEVIVLASIIEREARDYEQKQNIANILLTRLDEEIMLQVDASLQYMKGYDENKGSYWGDVYNFDKEKDSSFNTYMYLGLPSSPICNPGFDSINSVLNPLANDYLFYLHSSDGAIYFAKDYQGHRENIANYLR